MTPLRPECDTLVPLRNALLQHLELTPIQRCIALDALKRALCPCHEICDRWVRLVAGLSPGGDP